MSVDLKQVGEEIDMVLGEMQAQLKCPLWWVTFVYIQIFNRLIFQPLDSERSRADELQPRVLQDVPRRLVQAVKCLSTLQGRAQ